MLTDDIMSNKFEVLGHPLRLSIIRFLIHAGSSGLPAGQMGKQLKTAPNAMTFHLQKLHHAGSLEKCGAECPSNKHIGDNSYENKITQKEI